jgi:hypothetical protein
MRPSLIPKLFLLAEENRDRYIYGLFYARSEAFFTHLVGQVAMELRRQGRAQMEFGHEEKAPPLGTAAAT